MNMQPRTNHIFVDYENIQDIDLDLIAGKPVIVYLVLGGGAQKVTKDLTFKIHKHADQVRLIETSLSAHNALDMVIACEIGVVSVADPGGYFHILSKDKGFEAVVRHLKEKKIFGARHEVFAKIPVLAGAKVLSIQDRVAQMKELLEKPKATRPARKKTLLTHINASFGKSLTDAEVEAVAAGLEQVHVLKITPEGKVVYRP